MATTYAGYIGVNTGTRNGAFSISGDQRNKGKWWENLISALADSWPTFFLQRMVSLLICNCVYAFLLLGVKALRKNFWYLIGEFLVRDFLGLGWRIRITWLVTFTWIRARCNKKAPSWTQNDPAGEPRKRVVTISTSFKNCMSCKQWVLHHRRGGPMRLGGPHRLSLNTRCAGGGGFPIPTREHWDMGALFYWLT